MDRCAISDLICVVHCLKTIMFIFLTCLYFSGSCVFNNALTVPDVAFYGAVSGNQNWHQKQSPHDNDMPYYGWFCSRDHGNLQEEDRDKLASLLERKGK